MDPLSLIAGVCVCLTGHERFAVREAATVWLVRHADHAPALLLRGQASEESRLRCLWAVGAWAKTHQWQSRDLLRPSGWTESQWYDAGGMATMDLLIEGRVAEAVALGSYLSEGYKLYCGYNGLPVPP